MLLAFLLALRCLATFGASTSLEAEVRQLINSVSRGRKIGIGVGIVDASGKIDFGVGAG